MDRLTWFDLLNAYGIDMTKRGGADFAELVFRLINGYRWTGEKQSVGKCVEEMCRTRKCGKQVFYTQMKFAIMPLLNAADITLEAWDLFPERRTTTAMAVAIAEREIRVMGDARRKKTED